VVEHLPSMPKTLGLSPISNKIKTNKNPKRLLFRLVTNIIQYIFVVLLLSVCYRSDPVLYAMCSC
jgi:hypothetical protein